MEAQERKIKKENKKRINYKKWLKKYAPVVCISFAVFLVLVGVIMALLQAEEELVQYTIKDEELYTYSAEVLLEFDSQITLDNKDNITKLLYGGEEMTLFTEPIYYKTKKQVIFPSTMSVVFPTQERQQKKINRYAIVETQNSSHPIVKNVGLNRYLIDAFLYDGGDVYFFLESGKLKFADKEYEISEFSFARRENNGALSVYNYEANQMIHEENFEGAVMVEFPKYTVNISYDTLYVNGEPSLLNKNISSLEKLEK